MTAWPTETREDWFLNTGSSRPVPRICPAAQPPLAVGHAGRGEALLLDGLSHRPPHLQPHTLLELHADFETCTWSGLNIPALQG